MTGTTAADPLAPVEETVQHKTDVLDWSGLDDTVCALEYRLHVGFTPGDHLVTIGIMMFSSVVAVPLAAMVGVSIAPRIARWDFAAVTLGLGAVLALCQYFARESRRVLAIYTAASAPADLIILLPLFLWFAVCLTGHLLQLAGAFLFLIVALLVSVAAVDQIATHAVYWMTASAYLDYSTAQAWRADWLRRFVALPSQELAEDDEGDEELRRLILTAMRARAAYVAGLLWVLAAVVVPNVLIVLMNTPATKATLGLQLVVGTIFGLLMVAVLRSRGTVRMLVRYWSVVSHYFHYGTRIATAPWMFQSPFGDATSRRLAPIVSAGLLSVALFFLAADSFRRLALAAETLPASSTTNADPALEDTIESHDNAKQHHFSFTISVLLTVACAAPVAPTALLLLGIIVIGPVVDAYYEALET